MINIHLYPSPFLNESRILREVATLVKLRLFDRIDLVGVGQSGLPANARLGDSVRIVRIGQRDGARGLFRKVADTIAWSKAVYMQYRHAAVTCINCHSVAVLPLAVLLKRVTGARLIYDAHELETETNGLHGVRKFFTKTVERLLIGAADHCIFVGSAIDDWYVREYGLRNTTVIYNCPPHQSPERSDYFRETFPIPPRLPIFLYQGVIGEGRGLRILVEAFSALGGKAALVVMGYGALKEWFVIEAKRYPNMHFHPAVPPDRLLGYTSAADFGLSVIEATSMSYEYCMPNKLFEYVMARKPVLVSPTLEQMSFVERQGVGGVVDNLSAEAVRAGVLALLARPPGSFSPALDRAREEFCWERQEQRLESVYLDALRFRPQSASATATLTRGGMA